MKVVSLSDTQFLELMAVLSATHPTLFGIIMDNSKTKGEKPRKKREDPGDNATNAQYFLAAWDAWPKTVKGKWIPGQGYENRVVLKGSRKMAMDNFLASILGDTTARMLYVAAIAYLNEAPSVKEGYVQNVATFYGTKKATYLEWLDRANEMIHEQDAADGREA